MTPQSLIIFDYSGTLSTQAPGFARPEHLLMQLAECGLSVLGIDGTEIFWNEIVNPTWEEGSTTGAGYANMMADRIRRRRCREPGAQMDEKAIHEAAARFVQHYMAYSTINPRWEPLLAWLNTLPGVLSLIATDHYAEATDAIMTHLQDRCMAGKALRDITGQVWHEGDIVIANSADLGAHKAESTFWELVQARLPLEALRRILIIDDFGAHEQAGDAYGMASRLALRRQQTVAMLAGVFQVPVTALDFASADAAFPESDPGAFDVLIQGAINRIRNYLQDNHESFRCQSDQ